MPRWPDREPIGDPNDPHGFESLIRRFEEWQAVRHYSDRTLESTRRAVLQFAVWCGERGMYRPSEVTRDVVERYQRWLYHYRKSTGQPLAVKTQSVRLSHVRSFFKYLAKERFVLYNPAAELVLPKKPPRLPTERFSPAEVEQILSSLDVSDPLGLRDRAMLEVLYATGIRRMELVNLDLYDLDFDRDWLAVRQGKGGKDRMVPLGERASAWVSKYLEASRPELVVSADEWAVFVSHYGVRFNPGALTNVVRRLLKQSGVRSRQGACHLFRHTAATLMLEGGADIRYIQEMLGHASVETTQIYTKVSIHKLAEIHRATHPGARLARSDAVDAELAEEQEELVEGRDDDGGDGTDSEDRNDGRGDGTVHSSPPGAHRGR